MLHDCPLNLVGLSCNMIRDEDLERAITSNLPPSLYSIDLAYNELCDLPAALATLEALVSLRQLTLHGNPLCIRPSYRSFVLGSSAGRRLATLDGMRVPKSLAASAAAPTAGTAEALAVDAPADQDEEGATGEEAVAVAETSESAAMVTLQLRIDQLEGVRGAEMWGEEVISCMSHSAPLHCTPVRIAHVTCAWYLRPTLPYSSPPTPTP